MYYVQVIISWNAMLKMTKIELELISDPDMCIFFDKGTRRGISYISNTLLRLHFADGLIRKI